MIHQFKVKNYLSIREEQVLDFTASKSDKTYDEYTIVSKNKIRLSKLGIIYGANASGKSNILFALDWLLTFIAIEPEKRENQSSFEFKPFLLDSTSRDKETSMYLSFFIEETRFEYSITLDKNRILNEELNYYPNNRKASIYKRHWNREKKYSTINFGSSCYLKAHQKTGISTRCTHKCSVLSAYLGANIEHSRMLDKIVDYFQLTATPLIMSYSRLENFANKAVKESDSCREFIHSVLKKADFNISNIRIAEAEIPQDIKEKVKALTKIVEEREPKDNEFFKEELFFSHETPFHKEEFPEDLESLGTKRIYGLASILYFLVKANVVVTIDELESSLHYDLLSYFIKLFLTNSQSGQLIFSTHSLMLLDEPFIRRDSIFFCEKNIGGATEVYNAKDFGLSNNVSILNAYKAGKLGAKPKLGNIFIEDYL